MTTNSASSSSDNTGENTATTQPGIGDSGNSFTTTSAARIAPTNTASTDGISIMK